MCSASGLALLVLQVPGVQVAAASIKGLSLTLRLLFIIFWADSAAEYAQAQRRAGSHPHRLCQYHRRPACAIIIALLFEAFIEGAAGFGTPATVTVLSLQVVRFLGPEFSSLFGALIGLAFVVPVGRRGWLFTKGDP